MWLPVVTVGGLNWILTFHGEACLPVMLVGIEGLRFAATPRLRHSHLSCICLCLALCLYLVWLMCVEPFFVYDNLNFIVGVLLVTPLLFAMSPLVRWRAWVGLSGTVVFFATSIAMMTQNACSRGGMTGFFEAFVY
jgi:hypothetical protein